jgi:hypothetical protein
VAQHGSGPPRFAGEPGPDPRRRWSSDDLDQPEELPPWAVPGPLRPARARPSRGNRASDGEGIRPEGGPFESTRPDSTQPDSTRPDGDRPEGGRPRGRAQAAKARRARRRGVLLAGIAVTVAVIAAIVYVLLPGPAKPAANPDGFVTTYQPGELRSVPDTCKTVSASTLSTYLPGKLTQVTLPALSGNSGNQCDWTLDHKPSYLLLNVTAQAYAPSGLATGNGSATDAAQDGYTQAMQAKQHPASHTHQPPAQIITDHGLGQSAFSAFQVITVSGDVTYRVTLVARYRNVLVTVAFSGLNHAHGGGYGPVSTATLVAGAKAAAQNVLAALH